MVRRRIANPFQVGSIPTLDSTEGYAVGDTACDLKSQRGESPGVRFRQPSAK
jgi:hypothetical protein